MGGSSSKGKIKKLKPKTLKELQSCVDVDFTVEEIEHWFKEYRESLSKGLDKLTEKEFRDVYNSVFSGDAKEFTRHLFRTFDTNGDGFVDFKEFIVGLCVSGSDNTNTRLRWAFRMYDYDGNGFITRDEMAAMLKAIYKMVSTDVQEAENDVDKIDQLITDFFTKADKNNDNAISMEEFVGGVNSMPIILNLLQCDPEPEMLDENVVGKFDELEVKETNMKTELTKSGDESRSKAYTS